MLPYRRLASAFKSCLFSISRPITSSIPRRTESSSPTTLDTGELTLDIGEQAANDEEGDFQNMVTQRDSGPASYRQFLEEIGYKYKFASPQLWLGDKVVEFVS